MKYSGKFNILDQNRKPILNNVTLQLCNGEHIIAITENKQAVMLNHLLGFIHVETLEG